MLVLYNPFEIAMYLYFFRFHFNTSAEKGAVLGTVKAVDKDTNLYNSKISYSIASSKAGSDDDRLLEINPETGDIHLKKGSLNKHKEDIILEVVATDSGSPQKTSSVPVIFKAIARKF